MARKVAWLVAIAALAIAVPAAAVPTLSAATPGLTGAEIVPDDELDRNRGGFEWSGVEIALGAEMRTYLNGSLALQTNVSWTPTGVQTTQSVSGALTRVDSAQLQSGILAGAGITMHIGNQSVFLANGGQTALIQSSHNGLQNVLVNRASNIQISQQVDATIGLSNYGQLSQSIMSNRLANSFGDAIAQSSLGAGH